MNCGLFLYSASANPRTSNSPLRTKFRYQIVTEKLPSDYCNDFHANSLICPLLSQFCLLIIQLITFPLWHCVTIVTKDIKTDAFMSKSTFKILFYLRKNYVNKEGKASIMIRITVNGEMSQFSSKLDVEPRLWDTKLYKPQNVL